MSDRVASRSPAGRADGHDLSSHPLMAIRGAVLEILDSPDGIPGAIPRCADLEGVPGRAIVLLCVLQTLYSLRTEEQVLDQLRFNRLFQEFVGLPAHSPEIYDVRVLRNARIRITGRDSERSVMRCVFQAVLRSSPARSRVFNVDWPEMEKWSTTGLPSAVPSLMVASGDSADPSVAASAARDRVALASAHIQEHLSDLSLRAETVAKALGISRRALFLAFKAAGVTPTKLIQNLRLEDCRVNLLDPRNRARSIAFVASESGFSNYATFNRLFKARYGSSPSAYRASRRQGFVTEASVAEAANRGVPSEPAGSEVFSRGAAPRRESQ